MSGTDQLIHECFFFIGGDRLASQRAQRRPGAGGAGHQPDELVHHAGECAAHRLCRRRQLIHECFFFIGGDDVWHHSVPGAGQMPVAPGTSPTSWYTTPENVQHIAYVGTDQPIHECFFFIGGDNVWHHNVPSAGQALVAPGTSPTSWYTTPENVQHIAYVGADRQIHECFFFIH